MANHSFETSGFEALEVSSTNDLAFTPPEQFVPARGWSCSQERRANGPSPRVSSRSSR